MLRTARALVVAAVATALTALVAGGALAQLSKGGKIICWKDSSGKVVGCGDAVPPEYQSSATKELDSRGVTRGTTESAEVRAKREAQEKELAQQKAEEAKRAAERRRQDAAMLATFTNAQEIDLKRDRDLQVADTQLTQQQIALKNAVARVAEVTSRIKAAKGPVSDYNKEELARAESSKTQSEQAIAAKEKDMAEIRKRYADMKERYIQLKGGAPAPAAPAAKAAAVPSKK